MIDKDLIALEDWTSEDILRVLDLADAVKAEPGKYRQALAGKVPLKPEYLRAL